MTTYLYSAYQEYRVTDVSTVKDFLSRYYKPERYTGRGEEYADHLLDGYKKELEAYGFVFISRHDSVTGKVVSFYSDRPVAEDLSNAS